MESDWMRREFQRLEFVRSDKYFTFKAALNLFLQRNGQVIVETGTMRVKDDPGGCSTLLFGAFCKRYDKLLITVDVNTVNLKLAMDETANYADYIRYIHNDSVEFLEIQYPTPKIDLLYLDSMDCPMEGDATKAQEHQLHEFLVAQRLLRKGLILLADDNNFPNGGKTRLLKQHLLTRADWQCILDSGQTLWEKVE
jgi:hypothetical protein